MRLARLTIAVLLFITIILPACTTTTYEIQMAPKGEAIHRKTTQIRDQKRSSAKIVHDKSFTHKTPKEVGGSGTLTTYKTSFGTLYVYLERFQGNIDLLAQIEKQNAIADRLANYLRDWFNSELANDPNWPKLHKFINDELRRDLKNIALYAWRHRNNDDGLSLKSKSKSKSNDLDLPPALAQIAQYLTERGYFTLNELPRITRTFGEAVQLSFGPKGPKNKQDQLREKQLTQFIQRTVARRMGIPDTKPIPDSLAFLSSIKSMETSFNRWYQSTGEYRKQLAAWAALPENNRPKKPVGPDWKNQDPGDLIGFELFSSSVFVDAKLKLPAKPIFTNGKFDPKSSTIAWHQRVDRDNRIPVVAYATWAVPNPAAQKAKFGKTLLSHQTLGAYCLWHKTLSTTESREWASFLKTLNPNQTLKSQLNKFLETTTSPWLKESTPTALGLDEDAKPHSQ